MRVLISTLMDMVKRDAEQEVQGVAVPVLDAVLGAAREWMPEDDPILDAVRDVISVENIEAGEPIRAVDALMVARQVETALTNRLDEQRRAEGPMRFTLEPGPFDNDY